MESSPLAAIRPQPCPMWGGRKDVPISRAMYRTYGPNSFDFKSMSMQQCQKPSKQDYFTLRPMRGSSPTASLTADLDANFHIDKSPVVPTPRRSLFTTDPFKPRDEAERLMTPPIEAEEVTTPDVPSSSPGIDAMDVSPLPHKAPYFVAQIALTSPSPEGTPCVDEMSCYPSIAHQQPILQARSSQTSTFLQLPERRRPVTRPSLSRSKSLATSFVTHSSSNSVDPLPPFRFGNAVSNGLSCSSTPSLLESFTEPPVEETVITSAQQMPPPPPPRRPSMGAFSRTTGSPSSGHVRKPSTGRPPLARPARKLMRRSLSMFQHPNDVMKEEQDTFEPQTTLTSVMDVDQEFIPQLPHFIPDDEPDSLPRISQETLVDLLDSQHTSKYDRILIVDCRFEYEYNGGHIESAVNFNDKQQLAHELFPVSSAPASSSPSTLLILHCEYSVHRAPLTAKFIRNHDRNINAAHYPRLTYPEMYILDGGYSKFFAQHRSKCYPQNYVEMNDQRHEQACELGMAKVKQQRQKLFRHQTFAFGQTCGEEMDCSPTAQGRKSAVGRSQSSFDVGISIAPGVGLVAARRMASY